MNLPDYSRCVEFHRLHVEMGIKFIPTVPPISCEEMTEVKAVRELLDPEDAAVGSRLRREAVPVDRDDVADLPNMPLLYRGRLVCVYVRDQHDSVAFAGQWRRYAYHLFFCSALQRMKPALPQALLATQRSDGVFEVYDLSDNFPRKTQVSLGLCPDCREILKEHNWFGQSFDLHRYFDAHDVYQTRKLQEMEAVKSHVSSDDLADVYREVCDYVCQACGVNCSDGPNLLHLHFEDGNPTHTDPTNLHMLCVDCHAHQPGHDHMKIQPIVQADIEDVQILRFKQQIVSLRG